MKNLYSFIDEILPCSTKILKNEPIGYSREERPIYGYSVGKGAIKISLIGGCHADEPVGPMFLRKLVNFLDAQTDKHPLLTSYTWYIIPHCNPDGEAKNKKWYSDEDTHINLVDYLTLSRREAPGEDIEFGFPIKGMYETLRVENKVIFDFWVKHKISFHLHASLHGMAKSYGPWFLLDRNWIKKTEPLQQECITRAHELGYTILHDVDRKGEKGFTRITKGFCTRPDSSAMRKHFLLQDDTAMASLFRPSSMESVRSFSGNTLTLVSEMPLFILPQTNDTLSWPNPELEDWSETFLKWKLSALENPRNKKNIIDQALKLGVKPMPIVDQMKLQWQLIVAGIKLL